MDGYVRVCHQSALSSLVVVMVCWMEYSNVMTATTMIEMVVLVVGCRQVGDALVLHRCVCCFQG